jgi:acyl carrier protein
MSRDIAFDLVARAISNQFGISQSSIRETTVAADVAGWDSFAHSNLLMALEVTLPRPISLHSWLEAENVGDLVRLVSKSLSETDNGVGTPAEADINRGEVNEVFETSNYRIVHYPRSESVVVVVMVSAGREHGEPILEFKWTLQKLHCSMLFVIDKHCTWYNYPENGEVFRALAKLTDRYQHVGALGGSMGGSGAFLAAHYLSKVSRVLSFSPQYSLMPPFINFDVQYKNVVQRIERHINPHFAFLEARENSVVIYGNLEWQDYLHSAMYAAQGFPVLYVDQSLHNVALFLETKCDKNKLVDILELFVNFDRPFTSDSVARCLGKHLTPIGLKFTELRFHVDRFDCQWINGWADLNGPVSVSLILNGALVADFDATGYRSDLAAAGIGDGFRAFAIPIGNYLRAGQNHVVLKAGQRTFCEQSVEGIDPQAKP